MRILERLLGGHVHFRLLWIWPLTVYGMNAMHFAWNLYTKRWGWICFRPTTYHFGSWWRWYFYVSPNATPWAATFKIGPGIRE